MDRLLGREEKVKTPAEREAIVSEIYGQLKSSAGRALMWAEGHPDDPEATDAVVWAVEHMTNGYRPEYAEEMRRAGASVRGR